MEDSNRILFHDPKSDKKRDELYLRHRIENLEEEREILFKKIASLTKELTEIYIVYDPLCEKVISAHKSEECAVKRCEEKDGEDNRTPENTYYTHQYDKYILED